jgi:hypothetical protein
MLAAAVPLAAFTAIVLACGGEGPGDGPTFVRFSPGEPEKYARGSLGFVKPTFARRYLVQAYRVLSGLPAVRAGAFPTREQRPSDDNLSEQWSGLLHQVLGPADAADSSRRFDGYRRTADYQSFLNCGDETLRSAVRTLDARIKQYGATGREVQEWTRGQLVVLQNCNTLLRHQVP